MGDLFSQTMSPVSITRGQRKATIDTAGSINSIQGQFENLNYIKSENESTNQRSLISPAARYKKGFKSGCTTRRPTNDEINIQNL